MPERKIEFIGKGFRVHSVSGHDPIIIGPGSVVSNPCLADVWQIGSKHQFLSFDGAEMC